MSTDFRTSGGKLDQSISPEDRPHRQELYHRLFELMPGSVVLMDARGFVLDANPAFCRQIGFSREELLGAHVSRFVQAQRGRAAKNPAHSNPPGPPQ